MAQLELDISDQAKLPEACQKLIEFAGGIKVFAFNGEMGSGKTTLIKELCKVLGSKDNFSSPTYSIVNEYNSPIGKIFHFDLYRLKTKEELYDIGFEEYSESGNFCFVEWPEMAESLLIKPFMTVIIKHSQKNRYLSARITR